MTTNLEQRRLRAELRRLRERMLHEPAPDRATSPIGMNRDVLDLESARGKPATKIADHGGARLSGETGQYDLREGKSKLTEKDLATSMGGRTTCARARSRKADRAAPWHRRRERAARPRIFVDGSPRSPADQRGRPGEARPERGEADERACLDPAFSIAS